MASQVLPVVLATPELFEALLAEFTIRELLLAQLVNHHWHYTITASPTLQQKLFFQPIPERHNAPPQLNPLLQALFDPFFKLGIDLDTAEFYMHASNHKDLTAMPWVRDNFPTAPKLDAEDWFADGSRKAAFLRPKASWRRMFPVQPPARISKLT